MTSRRSRSVSPGRLAAAAFGGALLANAVPHGVNGVQGRRFPSPFASPPGRGLSGPATNVLWSGINAVSGTALVIRTRSRPEKLAAAIGALAMAFALARYFAPLHPAAPRGSGDTSR